MNLYRYVHITIAILLVTLIDQATLQSGGDFKEGDYCGDVNSYCSYWEFRCSCGGCINMRKFCDGKIDCPDGSDEIVATSSYIDDISAELSNGSDVSSIPCNSSMNDANGTCKLPSQYSCDSIPHCSGNLDEGEHVCGEKNRYRKHCFIFSYCINEKVQQCEECVDLTACNNNTCSYIGNDENHRCASVIFKCNSGACLRADQFCDGVVDCPDGSDEITNLTSTEGITCRNKWNYVDRECLLPQRFMCDGIDHCENRVDECGEECIGESDHSFKCNNGKCISRLRPRYVANNRDDCGDSSDEFVIPAYDVERVFKCNDSDNTKLAVEMFCDGVVDCPNGADEKWEPQNISSPIFCANYVGVLDLKCFLPDHHKCDKVRHCKDHSDEWDCDNDNYFSCDNKKLVLLTNKQQCNFVDDCSDSSDECPPTSNCTTTFNCLSDNKCIAFSRFCDGKIDCDDGSDEIMEGSDFMCDNAHNSHNKKCILPPKYQCDGQDHCLNREDECQSGCSHSFFCGSGECLTRSEFCNGVERCFDGSDERVNGFGFKCAGKNDLAVDLCILPPSMVVDSVLDCADQADSCLEDDKHTCFRCLSNDMYISTKQVCDGYMDCPDLSDECLCDERPNNRNTSNFCTQICLDTIGSNEWECNKCKVGEIQCDGGNVCISISQVCDDVTDCLDGSDEIACTRQKSNKPEYRKSDYVCPLSGNDTPTAVQCDGIPECNDFADECSTIVLNNSTSSDEFTCGSNRLEICSSLEKGMAGYYTCAGLARIKPSQICNGVDDCSNGRRENNSSETRTFDDLSLDERHCNSRFLCHKSRPKDKDKVTINENQKCDGKIDCEMEEDEAEELCGGLSLGRFYCETRRSSPGKDFSKDPLFVSKRSMFDGKEDCSDGSDECPTNWFDDNPFSSRYRLIKDIFLSGLVWVMAILALVGNFVVVWHTSNKLIITRRTSPMMRTNYVLVLNLAIADFLMGIYLFALAIKNATTSGSYCSVDRVWRSSFECASLGTLALISVQCSVLILIILTTYRVMAVLRPFSADSMHVRYTGVLVSAAWLLSILIACLPRMSSLEDYFTSAAWVSPGLDFFATDTPNKTRLQLFAKRLSVLDIHGAPALSPDLKTDDITWTYIRSTLNEDFPEFWSKYHITGYFGFYASNSVCLPKMFVTVEDSAWAYSAAIMTFDLISFFYIMTSYLVIYHDARRVVANNRNDDENRTMQARITRLVLTDFACWGPMCILAFLSLFGVHIPSVAYAFAAIILLPINSALNPILYSNVLNVIYSSCFQPASAVVRKRVRSGRQSLTRARKRSSYSRGSVAASMTSNDYILQSPDGAVVLTSNGASSFHNGASVATTNTRL